MARSISQLLRKDAECLLKLESKTIAKESAHRTAPDRVDTTTLANRILFYLLHADLKKIA